MNQNNIINISEEIAKKGYAISLFAFKAFYRVSNLEALKNSMDDYIVERFSQRLEYFVYEHEKLSFEEKQKFYNDLANNQQNLNYLYEFVEKARTSTFDLHAKILAKLSVNFIKNKSLNYEESTLLSNMNIFVENDFIEYYKQMKNLEMTIDENDCYCWAIYPKYFITDTAIMKFINLGILVLDRTTHKSIKNGRIKGVYYTKTHFSETTPQESIFFYKTDFAGELIDILDEIFPASL